MEILEGKVKIILEKQLHGRRLAGLLNGNVLETDGSTRF
jgi:hypothetical protein